jgi:hypothetical protein
MMYYIVNMCLISHKQSKEMQHKLSDWSKEFYQAIFYVCYQQHTLYKC